MKNDLSIKRNKWSYLLLAVVACVYISLMSLKTCDLDVFIDAASKFNEGRDPYSGPFVRDLQFYYSPCFAMLLALFIWIPPIALKFIWMTLIVLSSWRIAHLFKLYFKPDYNDKRTIRWIGLSILFSSYFIMLNMRATQMTVFMIWACFESLRLVASNKSFYAGILLGLFINFKILLLPFFCYLIYRGHFKAAIYTLLAFVFYLFLPAVMVGWQSNITLLSNWWHTINPGNQEHMMELETGRYSLSALLPAYVPERYFAMVLMSARLIFIGLTLWFLQTKPFVKAPSNLHQFRELSYLCMVIVLIFPHQGYYAFFCLSAAFSYLTYFFVFQNKNHYFIRNRILMVFYLLCLLLIFVGKDTLPETLYDWMFQYHTMTWAVIGLVIIMAVATPKTLKNKT